MVTAVWHNLRLHNTRTLKYQYQMWLGDCVLRILWPLVSEWPPGDWQELLHLLRFSGPTPSRLQRRLPGPPSTLHWSLSCLPPKSPAPGFYSVTRKATLGKGWVEWIEFYSVAISSVFQWVIDEIYCTSRGMGAAVLTVGKAPSVITEPRNREHHESVVVASTLVYLWSWGGTVGTLVLLVLVKTVLFCRNHKKGISQPRYHGNTLHSHWKNGTNVNTVVLAHTMPDLDLRYRHGSK